MVTAEDLDAEARDAVTGLPQAERRKVAFAAFRRRVEHAHIGIDACVWVLLEPAHGQVSRYLHATWL